MKLLSKLDPTKCSKSISHSVGGWYRGERQCSRKWSTTTKDGKHFCKQHNPASEKKRDEVATDKYKYDTASRAMGWYGMELYRALHALTVEGDATGSKLAKKALKVAKPYYEALQKGKPR